MLVVEDDRAARKLAVEIFTTHGYTALEAIDGEDAIKRFSENKDRIDLVLLDVIMPRKNGTEVYDEIRKIDPDVKVLFVSGYAREVIVNKSFQDGAIDFIAKPLSPQVLLTKVREVLDK